MSNGAKESKDNTLRARAEKRLKESKKKELPVLSGKDAQQLIHELQVHQMELEMQNEELQRTMAELADSTAKYADFYEFTPVGYLTLDEEGRIRESNLMAATLLGKNRSSLMEKPFELLIQPESLPALRLFLKDIFSQGSKQTCELRLIISGAERFIDLEGVAVANATNKAVKQCRAVMIDITRQKQVEKELESFSYSVSHDLREPLRAIDGYSRILLRDLKGKLDDETQRKFDVIREKCKRMDHLITDVLEFSRLGRKKLTHTVIDLGKLLTEVWDELKETHGRGEITMKSNQLSPCYGDEGLVRQALANLLSNAVKFSSKKESATIEVGGQEGANECVYYVKDNGIGFDMAFVDKLFHIFRRLHTDEEFEGTGVGLSIVKRIAELHGGRVWAEGKVGEGATFYFTLPKVKRGITSPPP